MRRAAVFLLVLSSTVALAKAQGFASPGCSGCHGGNQTHMVTIVPSVAAPAPGQAITLTVTLKGTGSVGGLYLRSGGVGTFANQSGATKLFMGEVIHSTPKAASGGQVVFTAQWTAPSTPGGTDFEVFSLLGNGNNGSNGDSSGAAKLTMVWGCAGITLYGDFDRDGYGAMDRGTTTRCVAEPGWADKLGDCDDNDERIRPNAVEACNGKDENCNAQIDEGLTSTTTYPDNDKDGYGAVNGAPATGCATSSRAPNNTDCNDNDAKVRPGVAEVCDGFDQDCDNIVDEGVRVRCGVGWCARYGPTCDPQLCFPGDPIPETCNYLDDDCDNEVDEGVTCPGGEECLQGQCVKSEGTGGGAGGGGGTSADGGTNPVPTSSCSTVPGILGLLGYALVRPRMRLFSRRP